MKKPKSPHYLNALFAIEFLSYEELVMLQYEVRKRQTATYPAFSAQRKQLYEERQQQRIKREEKFEKEVLPSVLRIAETLPVGTIIKVKGARSKYKRIIANGKDEFSCVAVFRTRVFGQARLSWESTGAYSTNPHSKLAAVWQSDKQEFVPIKNLI